MPNDEFTSNFEIGLEHHRAGRLLEAKTIYRRILSHQPRHPEATHYLGVIAAQAGHYGIAFDLINKAISFRPDYPEAYCSLGNVLSNVGRRDEAIAAYRKAVEQAPAQAEAHCFLANALREAGEFDEALSLCERAIQLNPGIPECFGAYANVLRDRGEFAESIKNIRKGLALEPRLHGFHSSLIMAMLLDAASSSASLTEELRHWNRMHADPLKNSHQLHLNDPQPDRKLRVGYVSGDFRYHVVGQNLLPLFREHDHSRFEITCYSDVIQSDGLTDDFRRMSDRWWNIHTASDQDVADQVRKDRIDVLVDLGLHTTKNRLLIFARKPAPVQVTFAGYPGSTGLTSIDYRLTDPYLDPVGMDESIYSEQTVRLPHSFWCYDPMGAGQSVEVGPLPALKNGIVTFGCLNSFCKLNAPLLQRWAAVMRQVKGSRLLLLGTHGSHHQRILDQLFEQGIDSSRVEFAHHRPRKEYLELYQRIDLGLDSFPYNGHTTSLDSFWMGVPVVTLVGETAVSRAGWCQLSNLGLTELAGKTPEEFVKIAVDLAHDLPRLSGIRSTLRERMEKSPLMDARNFARGIESAYRWMWRKWCETAPAA